MYITVKKRLQNNIKILLQNIVILIYIKQCYFNFEKIVILKIIQISCFNFLHKNIIEKLRQLGIH